MGTYTGSITIIPASQRFPAAQFTIPVVLTVSANTTVNVSPTSLSLHAGPERGNASGRANGDVDRNRRQHYLYRVGFAGHRRKLAASHTPQRHRQRNAVRERVAKFAIAGNVYQ